MFQDSNHLANGVGTLQTKSMTMPMVEESALQDSRTVVMNHDFVLTAEKPPV
jgi:hypothetical protein